MSDELKDPKWITMTMALSKRMIEFNSDALSLMYAPVVYVVFGEALVLYVGMSMKGLARVFDRNHHILSKDVWREARSIQVFEVDSRSAALTLEAKLIQEFKPIYNDRQCIRTFKSNMGVSKVIDRLSTSHTRQT